MTPRQLRVALVQSRLDEMRALLADLDRLTARFGPITGDALRTDRFHRHVAERVLSALVDLAVAVNAHILATTGDRVPTDAASTFRAMAALGVVPSDLADSLRPSVGLRNAIVHEYADVDLDLVAAAVPMARHGYSAYVGAVAGWVSDAPDAGRSHVP